MIESQRKNTESQRKTHGREQLISDLQTMILYHSQKKHYEAVAVLGNLVDLLKDQVPVKPITQDAWPNPVKVCGSCGGYITYTAGRPRCCPNCGCEVKWNDCRGEDLPTLREDGQAGDGDVCDEIVLGDGEDLPGVQEEVDEEAAGTGGR